MAWPKLIGGTVASVGIGLSLALGTYFTTSQGFMDIPLLVGWCLLGIASVVLVALSYFLWRCRLWALTALVAVCWLLAIAAPVFLFAGIMRSAVHLSDVLEMLGMSIAAASPPLWFAAMLRRPEITRTFSDAPDV